jgi:RIO-like serine/threonine protein kinase
MKPLDKILELLRDSQWHSLDEIKAHVSLPEDEFKKIIRFLEEQEFINLDKNRRRAKIKPAGLTFLELPTG